MKVVFIHRSPRAGGFSLEELFHTVAAELRCAVDVVEYQAGPRKSILADAWHLRKMNADVYHVTGDITYIGLFLPWHKTVLTIPDIGHFLFGLRGVKRWFYKWFWMVWPIRAARAVTSISRATEDHIVQHLRIDRSHITTIDCCYSPLFKVVERPFHSACPVILQVGTTPYKNVPRLIAALKGIPCKLVLIGQLDESLLNVLSEGGVEYVNRVNLSHAEIAQAYVDCDMVAFVSVGEGFGVPIIEAQASGRPLITANIAPMSVVAGEGACTVSPLDVTEIRAGILRILRDDKFRTSVVEAGLRNAARFSPHEISQQYLTLYERVISK